MKVAILKYLSISFLLLLFIFRGLETMLPLVKEYMCEQAPQENNLATESESNSEKSNEKSPEIKEFPGHFYEGYAPSNNYKLLTSCVPGDRADFVREIFLPVTVPPPRF